MIPYPVVANAPGLKWQRNKWGWIARWRPRPDIARRKFPIKGVRLWCSTEEIREPDPMTLTYIADRCQSFQADMLAWSRGGAPVIDAGPQEYNATWEGLVREYKTDEDSPYHKKEYATRKFYNTLCRRVVKDMGPDKIADTDTRRLNRLHEQWIKPKEGSTKEKISMGHAMIGMLRTLTTFGSTLLKCAACKQVRPDLHDFRAPVGKSRDQILTVEQIIAIRHAAHQSDLTRSIALAQALQFELALRQKDVIGAWVPLEERNALSDTISGNEKWIKGVRWEGVDENLILRHITSKRKKLITVDLTLAPMVMEELLLCFGSTDRSAMPAGGPIIKAHQFDMPWQDQAFCKAWRKLANQCGVPSSTRNMDTRATAITEASNSGASIEHIKHMATHSDIKMTEKYSRGAEDKVAGVMKARTAHRQNKTGT